MRSFGCTTAGGRTAAAAGTPRRAGCGMSWVASRKIQGLKKREQYFAFSSAGLLGLGGASPSNTGTYGRNLLRMIQLFRSLSVKSASCSKVYPGISEC